MSDIPFRVYGPRALNGGLGETLYTVPPNTQKFFVRDITLTNILPAGGADIRVRMSVGDISGPSNRVVDQLVSVGTPTFIRPLWLLDAAETLQGLQIAATVPVLAATTAGVASGADATSYASNAWIPAANTMYILTQVNGVASGTTALNPLSITGNGSWTLINQTTSTVAAAKNVGISQWWWYSSAAGSSATTTVNFSSTQHSSIINIASLSNVYPGTVAVSPWTSSATPIIQSAVASDSVAPGSTANSLAVTLPSAIQAGYAFYYCVRAGTAVATTPPTGFSEYNDQNLSDATGSICELSSEQNSVTAPPWTSTTMGPSTFSSSTTGARASLGFEIVPSGWVNCMVGGIEVH